MIKPLSLFVGFLLLCAQFVCAEESRQPVNIAIMGLVHDHAYGFIPLFKGRADVQLAGIIEPDRALAAHFADRFHLPENLFYTNLDELLARTNIQAVATFTSTFDHKRVVELCAPHHLDVMVEKPLAVSMDHARAIAKAAEKYQINIIVNYETSWYPGNYAAFDLVKQQNAIGDIRKVVVHDGHRGPKEIGCTQTFLNWLTDPVLDGGGALPDFGCYGADLMTYLMDGARPTSVFAVTQHFKPEVYPKVEDEATIVVTYPKAQGIIQASWNWAIDRKDMEIYGQTGYVLVPRKNLLRVRKIGSDEAQTELPMTPKPGEFGDPLSYLTAVERGETKPSGLSSLSVNLTVTEILEAAKKSAKTGRRIELPLLTR